MAAQSPEKEINRMIAQAKELSQTIIRQRGAIADDIKSGKSSSPDIQKLNSVIAQAKELAERISAAQDALISERVSSQKQEQMANMEEEKESPNGVQTPKSVLGEPGKVRSVPASEVIKSAVYNQPVPESKREDRSKSFTARQIEAAGVSSDYLTGHKTEQGVESRLKCIWHPWRDAYTTCKFCGRPFCYEDIIDKNGTAFCLEDVDRTEKPIETKSTRYQYGGIVAAMMFMLIFIVFIYFGYPQVVYQGGRLAAALPGVLHGDLSGLVQFESFVNVFPLLGILVSLMSFVSGLLVLADTKHSFIYGIGTSVVSIVLFSYAYLSYIRDYMIVITVISFLALVVLVTYKGYEYEAVERSEISDYLGTDLSNLTAY